MIRILISGVLTAGAVSGQPADERRELLEQRRAILAERLAEIDAELSGEVPPGTVRMIGGGRGPGRDMPPPAHGADGAPPRDSRREMLDPETRELLLTRLAEVDPELAGRIREMAAARRESPGPVFGRLRELVELRERDPEGFEIRRVEMRAGLEVLRHAGQLRDLLTADADSDEIDSAERALRQAVENGFDAKGAVLRYEIARTTERLGDMQRRLDDAEAGRNSIIEEHFQRLLRRIQAAADRGRGVGPEGD